MGLNELIRSMFNSWMGQEGPEGDIVLGTRIRLARNLREVPFPRTAKKEQLQQVSSIAEGMVNHLKDFGAISFLKMAEIPVLDRQLMVEKHLISPNHADNPTHKALLLRDKEDVSIMVNEEDHFRIQVLFGGLQLHQAWQSINELDDRFERQVEYAFDEEWGYLTACPTNVGTGMRASVMLHLPGLALVGQLSQVLNNVSKFGLSVRGIYGEGSESYGNVFQLSNQLTLGHAESETIEHLAKVTMQIIEGERQARDYLKQPDRRTASEDKAYRALGLLSHARVMSTREAMELLSDVRLGIDLGFINGLEANVLKELMVLTRAAHLQKVMGQNLPSEERDRLRADLIRERLASGGEQESKGE